MSVVMRTQRAFSEENGRLPTCANVRSCNCCPYGYHIDLDFVRYCEALANAKPSEEELRRRSKRRSRKSMEFMLGMENLFEQFDEMATRVQTLPEAPHESESDTPYSSTLLTAGASPYALERQRSSSVPRFTYGGLTRPESPFGTASSTCSSRRGTESDVPYASLRRAALSPPETRAFLREALDDVCSDFERTLERTSGRRKKNTNATWTPGFADRNNNSKTLNQNHSRFKEKRNGYAWPSQYADELDSCVAGNKSPRNSRFYSSLPLQRKPSPAEQQYESYVQSKVVENAKSPVEQLERLEQNTYTSTTITTTTLTSTEKASPLTPPPPPPRRHAYLKAITSPISTSSPLSGESSSGGGPGGTDDLLSPDSVADGVAPSKTAPTEAQTLYNIRQQMALSLRRMRDLEEQVKGIPDLQNELSELRNEKQRLQQSLQRKEEELLRARDNTRPSATPSPVASVKNGGQFTPQRISPVSLESLGARLQATPTPSPSPKLKREVGTMCARHNTRDIAVGSPVIMYRTVGTNPLQTLQINELLYTRVELDEHIALAVRTYEEQRCVQQLKKLISVGTQMYAPQRDVRETGAQTSPERAVIKYAVGVMARPITRENFVQCRPDVRSVGSSEDRVSDELCGKCATPKRHASCGTDEDVVKEERKSVSLKLLEMPGRSNTFSLGEHEKLQLIRKSTGSQCTPPSVHSAGSQTSATVVHAVGVQHVPEAQNAATQCHVESSSRQTDTRDLIRLCTTQTSTEEIAPPQKEEEKVVEPPQPTPPETRHMGSNTEAPRLKATGVNTLPPADIRHSASNTETVHKRDIACGDIVKPHISIACADNYCDSCKDAIKHLAKDFSKASAPPSPLPTRAHDSRIPRPKHITSPSPARRQFQRQNTYTITPSPTPSPVSEKKELMSSLHEKPPAAISFHQLESSSESQSFLSESITQQTQQPKRSTRTAEAKEDETQPPAASADTAYDVPQGLEGELIVREEKRVSISWSRDASPAPPKSLESSYSEQLKASTDSSGSSSAPVSVETVQGGARKKTSPLKSSQILPDVQKTEPENKTGSEERQQQQAATTEPTAAQQKPPSKALLQKLAMVETAPRVKVKPSPEMLAALKPINNSLLKKLGAKPFSSLSLKGAKNTIQEEWFRVSSTEQANPHDVEDYLDCFEELSVPLLEYCVNIGDSNGNTAMHYAVSHGNFDVVSILLDSKVCNVNQLNNAGYTSVMLVSLAKLKNPAHRTVVERLFQMADVNIRAKKHCQTALMLAVSHGNTDMVEMLLAAGADINIQDEDGSTALMCAAEHGRADIVKHLLSHPDCDSLVQDVDGSTAFKIAWQAGHRDIGVLLYVHEQMLRSKLPHRVESPRTPGLSPRHPKREPNK